MAQIKREKGVAPFLFKLYLMLQEPTSSPFIAWAPDARTFVIKDVQGFSNSLLPKYYKHSNFCSFVRQLNIYGFTKTKVDSTEHSYCHPLFIEGGKNKLKMIKRKSVGMKAGQEGRESDDEYFVDLKSSSHILQESSTKVLKKAMDTEIKLLQRKNSDLLLENENILGNSANLIIFLLQKIHPSYRQSVNRVRDLVLSALKQQKTPASIYKDIASSLELQKTVQNQNISKRVDNTEQVYIQQKIVDKSTNIFGQQNPYNGQNNQNYQNNNLQFFQNSMSQNFSYFSSLNNLNMQQSENDGLLL